MRAVSAREANQAFSRILQEAEDGAEVVITRRGKPVAVLSPFSARRSREQEEAVDHAIQLMRKGLPIGGRRFTRDEMHER